MCVCVCACACRLQLEQVSRERDKVRGDFQAADRRNLQLVREGDDGHAAMETLNHSRIRYFTP